MSTNPCSYCGQDHGRDGYSKNEFLPDSIECGSSSQLCPEVIKSRQRSSYTERFFLGPDRYEGDSSDGMSSSEFSPSSDSSSANTVSVLDEAAYRALKFQKFELLRTLRKEAKAFERRGNSESSEEKQPEWQTTLPEPLTGLILQYTLYKHQVHALAEDDRELYRICLQQGDKFASVDLFHATEHGSDIELSEDGQVASNARALYPRMCLYCLGRGYYPEAQWNQEWYPVRIVSVNRNGTYKVRWIEENTLTESVARHRLRPGQEEPANRCTYRHCKRGGTLCGASYGCEGTKSHSTSCPCSGLHQPYEHEHVYTCEVCDAPWQDGQVYYEDGRHNCMHTVRGSQWVATTAEASWTVRILRCRHRENPPISRHETEGVNIGVLREGFNAWSRAPCYALHAFSLAWEQCNGTTGIGVSHEVEHDGYAREVCEVCDATEEGPQPQSECERCEGSGIGGGFARLTGLPKFVEGDLVTVTIRRAHSANGRRELTFKLNGQSVGHPLPLPDGNLTLAVGLLQGMTADGSEPGCSVRIESSEYTPAVSPN